MNGRDIHLKCASFEIAVYKEFFLIPSRLGQQNNPLPMESTRLMCIRPIYKNMLTERVDLPTLGKHARNPEVNGEVLSGKTIITTSVVDKHLKSHSSSTRHPSSLKSIHRFLSSDDLTPNCPVGILANFSHSFDLGNSGSLSGTFVVGLKGIRIISGAILCPSKCNPQAAITRSTRPEKAGHS